MSTTRVRSDEESSAFLTELSGEGLAEQLVLSFQLGLALPEIGHKLSE